MNIKRISIGFVAIALLVIACCTGCSNAQFQRTWNTNGRDFCVDVYGVDGKLIHQYISSGKVQSEDHSDGWYFVNSADGKLHIISGGFVDIYPK